MVTKPGNPAIDSVAEQARSAVDRVADSATGAVNTAKASIHDKVNTVADRPAQRRNGHPTRSARPSRHRLTPSR